MQIRSFREKLEQIPWDQWLTSRKKKDIVVDVAAPCEWT